MAGALTALERLMRGAVAAERGQECRLMDTRQARETRSARDGQGARRHAATLHDDS
jgi:hypothetical protein